MVTTRLSGSAPLILSLLLALPPSPLPAQTPGPGRWIDADGRELPFSTDAELLEFLRTAPVVGAKQLSGGINNPWRLDLELPGYRVRAIFRDVDVTKRSDSTAAERHFPSFRDSYVFEVAAYEMSLLLGLDNVPPVVLYEWRGQSGSLQLWIERARNEGERLASGESPPDPAGWQRQKTSMIVFDNLIYNFDRNHGNQLLDERGKLWYIDHTRSFKQKPSLPYRDELLVLDARLWERLRSLEEERIQQALTPYLDVVQVKALLKRQRLLIRHIESMIESRGPDQVLLGRPSAGREPAAGGGSLAD
jgi:hypothetical protein